MPTFWVALMLVIVFSLTLGLLPSMGIGGIQYYILPCIANCFGGVATLARQSRSSMLEVIRSDYIITARSKGLSERKVIYNHALPNALIPIITVAGGNFAMMFGGSLIIETIFSIPGVGIYMIGAVNSRDYPVVQGCVIFLAITFSIMMLLVDLAYAFVDPRIKAQYIGNKHRKGGK
jgi:peptide/nickel transport system permease protein